MAKRITWPLAVVVLGAWAQSAVGADIADAVAPEEDVPVNAASELEPSVEEGVALPAAQDLVQRLRTPQESSAGLRLRARLEVDLPGEENDRAVQLMIKQRQDEQIRQTLLVAMWPRNLRGEALMIERSEQADISGFRFEPPDTSTPLTEADLGDPLFGTSVRPEDLIESFRDWPRHTTVGAAAAGRRECWVVESHKDEEAPFPAVRSCVGIKEEIPLIIERFDADGELIARIRADKLVFREDRGWLPAALTVESPLTQERASIRFTRSDRDVVYAPEEFTPEGVRALSAPKSDGAS